MPNDGSMEVLPISPCTSGNLGLDSLFIGTIPLKVVENKSTASLHIEKKEEKEEETEVKEKEEEDVPVAPTTTVETETTAVVDEVAVEDLAEKTAETTLNETNYVSTPTTKVDEKMATGVPNRPVLSGMPTHAQSRGLSAASLALKKKQAAENAALAIKAVAVEIPETDSISNRIKIFGGANPGRTGGLKKLNVKDMVQKFKDVEEQNQDQIAHVTKGHSSTEPRGVCAAYSLSTASRPTNSLRPTPRRKMSHELKENEVRQVVSATRYGSHSSEDDRLGVSQESVQSVRNAKSIFENFGRADGGGAQV
ncbi:hypothetical protein BGZ83_006827 [Gryganskiella cystojenkinii]|nr:hypothetical protein BGZ83_006827 [Gryganskiella cystojenkinii]